MGEMSFTFPPDLESWIEARVAEGRYADAADYMRDLVRRDQEGLLAPPAEDTAEETPEYIAWVREQVAIGLASGISDKEAFAFLDELKAGRYDAEG